MKKTNIQSRRRASIVLIVAATVFMVGLSTKAGLHIDKAYCGAEGSWRDVTAFLQSQVQGDTLSLTIAQPFKEIGGDPAWGKGKKLIIDYHLNGQPFWLCLEEENGIGFAINLPSPQAVAPGADPRASAITADISAHPPLHVGTLWHDWDRYLACLAFVASLAAVVCAIAALVQMQQLKRELQKSRNAA